MPEKNRCAQLRLIGTTGPWEHCYVVAITWVQTSRGESLEHICSIREETKSCQTYLDHNHLTTMGPLPSPINIE